jgi:hypothetical protein
MTKIDNNFGEKFFQLALFFTFIAMILETDLRSFGSSGDEKIVAASLFGVYIIDVGLVMPFFMVAWIMRLRLTPRNNLLFIFLGSIYLYGIFLFFMNGNPTSNIGLDLRACLALFSGLSLARLLPQSHINLARAVIVCSSICIFISTFMLLVASNEMSLEGGERVTSAAVFNLIALPAIFIGPSLVYAALLRKKILLYATYLNIGVLLFITIVYLQTRSLFIMQFMNITIAILVIFSLPFYSRHKINKEWSNKVTLILAILIALFATLILNYYLVGLGAFVDRMIDILKLEEDGGIGPRLAELPLILQSMTFFDLIFGVGFNPEPILTDWQGNSYNTSHIGLINIWWRFGIIVFSTIIILFICYLKRSFKTVMSQGKIRTTSQEMMNLICLPGLVSAFCISLMSGGWGLSTMLTLGLLWGIYKVGATLNIPNPYRID